ncbi:MAG: hypothetical protein GY880_16120, partial [Planctomycetaceae bacterium]|nr:hypothetical protein [Planctomycetaceae bacterium]
MINNDDIGSVGGSIRDVAAEIKGERGNKHRFRIVGNAADFYTLLFQFSSLSAFSMTPDDQFTAPLFAGVDVGGTNVKVGLVDNHGKIV